MCLSQVGEVSDVIDVGTALVEMDGTLREVSLAVLALEGVEVEAGDWLLVHTGLAVAVLAPDDAREVAELHRDIARSGLRSQQGGPDA